MSVSRLTQRVAKSAIHLFILWLTYYISLSLSFGVGDLMWTGLYQFLGSLFTLSLL